MEIGKGNSARSFRVVVHLGGFADSCPQEERGGEGATPLALGQQAVWSGVFGWKRRLELADEGRLPVGLQAQRADLVREPGTLLCDRVFEIVALHHGFVVRRRRFRRAPEGDRND